MKIFKMNWARTSWMRQCGYGNDSLVSFDCFIPKDIFEIIKPTFEGYVQKNEKKTAVYNLDVIGALLENTHQVELDGVNISKEDYNNSKMKIIGLCDNSTNTAISDLAKLYKEDLKQEAFKKEVSKTVDEAFGNKYFMALSRGVEIPKDVKFNFFRIGGAEYQIDFNYGVQKSITWEEISHEDFRGTDVYRAIPNKDKLPELRAFLTEAENFAKVPRANENAKWLPEFNAATYEPRKKNGYRP